DLPRFLADLQPGADIAVRHTVGLLDPIVAADQAPGERVDDGLPETLEEVVRHYRGRYYKLKVAGNVAADLERLASIAAVLRRHARRQRAIRRRAGHPRAVAGHARAPGPPPPRRRHPLHRAADQARLGAAKAGHRAGPAEAADHRRVGRRARLVPRGPEARL